MRVIAFHFSVNIIENTEKSVFPHFLVAFTTLGSVSLRNFIASEKSQLVFSLFLKTSSSAQLISESLPAQLVKIQLSSAQFANFQLCCITSMYPFYHIVEFIVDVWNYRQYNLLQCNLKEIFKILVENSLDLI